MLNYRFPLALRMAVARRMALAIAVAVTPFAPAQGQTKQVTKFPDGPVKLIVPFAPGGGVDTAARLLARQLQTNLGMPVIVENRASASGTVGGKAVQTATADGQTLLFSASTHVLAKEVLKVPPYDPV